jgi:hypothetical protein
MDITLPLKDQEPAEIVNVVAYVRSISHRIASPSGNSPGDFCQVKEQYPFIERYHHAWPVYMLMRQYLNNSCGYQRAKAKKANAEMGSPPPPRGHTGAGDGDQDGDQDGEVVISDIDN